jgi:arylsulfatase A-like enzyme
MGQPSIILIILDAVRADHLSIYGHEQRTTPHLESLIEEDNTTLYRNAFANSNWTGTSHGAMFTGRLPSESGVHGGTQQLSPEITTLPERVSEAGYRTFGMSAGAHLREGRGYGRGVDTFKETYRISPTRNFFSGLLSDPALRKQSIFSATSGPDKKALFKFESLKRWIASGNDPFFAFVNAKTAHHPYNPPRPHKSQFCPELQRPKYQFIEELFGDTYGERQSLPDADWERLQRLSYEYPVLSGEFEPTKREWDVIRSWYDGAIHYLDRQIGELIEWLRTHGELKDTYLMITADHGEYFGEHGMEKHYYGLYEPVLHVPLLVRAPERTPADETDELVSLTDLYPTIVELVSGTTPELDHAESLVPFNDHRQHEHVFAELGAVAPDGITSHHPDFDDSGLGIPTQVVRNKQHKLITRTDGSTELYNWREDSEEQSDLVESLPEVSNALREVIETELGTLSDEALAETIDDDELREHLSDLGYM